MSKTSNGWTVLKPGSNQLHTWHVPDTKVRLTTRRGATGFVLLHIASFWNDVIEPLSQNDSGCHNHRLLTGSKDDWSEHAAAVAIDLRWARHPYNVAISKTFTTKQIKQIRRRYFWLNKLAGAKVVIWGGDWPSHAGSSAKTDGMHTEVHPPIKNVVRLARILARTPRGKRVLAANPEMRRLILSL